ncbi:hypothetical protein V1512DRAFT_266746 [Lipomyces arxii]|uniref:uncharacterized protein n=1 Tax=Lipomyces arxii TaxID=56418 RepID=UPI0034CD6827
MNANRVLNNANIKNIKDQIQNISLYDVKAYVRKAQNVMMNFTVMEAKVREATNNEPWGASGTLMQEIADGTFNYASFNEIMPMIYRRFTEKTAQEWRQIYKALQLLEFLIKHGSERVVDDARAHTATISMLRAFHFTDLNGKDQGINVRNRSKELVALLGDDDKIRDERKKARAAKDKFVGVSSDGGFGGSGKKYGGFGSDSSEFGTYSGGVYGDGGGFGGASNHQYQASNEGRRGSFEEYDAGPSSSSAYAEVSSSPVKQIVEPVKPKTSELDLFSFDDADSASEPVLSSPQTFLPPPQSVMTSTGVLPPPPGPSVASTIKSQPAAAAATSQTTATPSTMSITDLFNNVSSQPNYAQPSFSQSQMSQPSYSQPALSQPRFGTQPMASPAMASPSYFGNASPSYQQPVMSSFSTVSMGSAFQTGMASPALSGSSTASAQPAKKKDDVFGSLWMAASSGASKKPAASNDGGLTMGKLAHQSAQAGIWDQAQSGASTPNQSSSNVDDLLM